MIRRILYATTAAAALLSAAPALAADRTDDGTDPCSCCSDGSMHHSDHHLRAQPANPDGRAVQPAQADDPYVRNGSFGG